MNRLQFSLTPLSSGSSKMTFTPPFHLLIALLIFSGAEIHSQDKQYARKVIDTLASPSMHGRGYVNDGHLIASQYVANEFKSFGLIAFEKSGSYFQEFSFPVNTFPGKVEMTVTFPNGSKEKCKAGEKFLVRCASPSVKGKFKVVRLDSSVVHSQTKWDAFMAASHKKQFVLVDTAGVTDKAELSKMTNFVKYPPAVKGILLPQKTEVIAGSDNCSRFPPWDFSMTQSTIPVIEIDPSISNATTIDVCIGA
jgi:hypothetical protein